MEDQGHADRVANQSSSSPLGWSPHAPGHRALILAGVHAGSSRPFRAMARVPPRERERDVAPKHTLLDAQLHRHCPRPDAFRVRVRRRVRGRRAAVVFREHRNARDRLPVRHLRGLYSRILSNTM